MDKKQSSTSVLLSGLIKENPVFVLLLGTCPTLAISTTALGGLGMGISATIVLICSNIVISMLKHIIPEKVRIPCYIVVIAGFVTVVQMLVQAFAPSVYDILGIYLPLITVNCIILGRAEMFASKNSVLNSALDGIGMGLGFTLALLAMGTIREIGGAGTWFGITLTKNLIEPMTILALPAGGFFVYGIMIALINRITKGKAPKRQSIGCGECMIQAECTAQKEEH